MKKLKQWFLPTDQTKEVIVGRWLFTLLYVVIAIVLPLGTFKFTGARWETWIMLTVFYTVFYFGVLAINKAFLTK